jgi:hypothetical protein
MKSYRSQVVIDRPPADVFPFLVEPQKQALWSDVPMRQVTEGPLKTGSKMEVSFGSGLVKATLGLELTAVDKDRRMAFKSYSGPIDWEGEYVLDPAGGGTNLSQNGTLKFHGLWRLLEPIVGAEISRGEVKELERLKSAAEAGA